MTIGAQAEFRRLLDAPALVAVGVLWMAIHAGVTLGVRRLLRAPIFFAAVGSQANVGARPPSSVVAAAFHPALAPVGVLLAVAGYVLGTYCGLVCAVMLERCTGSCTEAQGSRALLRVSSMSRTASWVPLR